MKKIGILVVAGLLTTAAYAEVGVSINVGQPGFYGQINLGDAPPPRLIYSQPVWVERPAVEVAPIYLRVPVVHRSHWRNYCYRYNACGRPVYFVQDRWYNDVYVPHYRRYYHERDGWRGGDRHWDGDRRWEHHGRDHWRDGRGEERREWRGEWRGDRDHGGGHGEGHGHGHDR